MLMAAPSLRVTYSFSKTDMKDLVSFGHIWSIKKFRLLHKITCGNVRSSTFSAGDENKWYLALSDGTGPNKDFVSLFLHRVPAGDGSLEVGVEFEFSILNGERGKLNIKKENVVYRRLVDNYGYHQYIRRDDLMNESKKFLLNNELIICCEIVMLSKLVTTSDPCDDIYIQDTGCRIIEDLDRLLENKMNSDVVLVAEDKELHAHVAILVARSPVFAAMFKHDLEETQNNRVVISDIKYSVLEAAIKFIYTGQLPAMDEKLTMKLLVAADKYGLEDLKLLCEGTLSVNLTSERVADLVILASSHNANRLKSRIIAFLKSQVKDGKLNRLWNDVVNEHPELIAKVLNSPPSPPE